MEFVAFMPNVEISGQSVIALLDGMGSFRPRGYEILAKHGIVHPSPNEWYSQQDWLDAFKMIHDEIGPVTLKMIGRKLAENIPVDIVVDNLETSFIKLDTIYHSVHRLDGMIMYNPDTNTTKNGIGNYQYVKTGDTSAQLICDTPYPCVFDMGGCEAMVNRFKTGDILFPIVSHLKEGGCRSNGDSSCTYEIRWRLKKKSE